MHEPLKRPLGPAANVDASPALSEAELLALEAVYCSHGDTVHYTNPPKIFESCEGSFLYDAQGPAYLDLQMWYSAVNFGYRQRAPQRRGAGASSTGCRRSRANICTARRSSWPPCWP